LLECLSGGVESGVPVGVDSEDVIDVRDGVDEIKRKLACRGPSSSSSCSSVRAALFPSLLLRLLLLGVGDDPPVDDVADETVDAEVADRIVFELVPECGISAGHRLHSSLLASQ